MGISGGALARLSKLAWADLAASEHRSCHHNHAAGLARMTRMDVQRLWKFTSSEAIARRASARAILNQPTKWGLPRATGGHTARARRRRLKTSARQVAFRLSSARATGHHCGRRRRAAPLRRRASPDLAVLDAVMPRRRAQVTRNAMRAGDDRRTLSGS